MFSAYTPDHFFDLHSSKYKELFTISEYVWDALNHLEGYIQSLPLGKIHIDIPPSVFLENPESISIGEGTYIEPGVYIKGPCVIGNYCHIRHGAYIRPNVLVGDSCVIGHTTEIKASILLNNAKAAHFAFIGDSIIGSDVNLGAGVICANLRFDNTPVLVKNKKQSLSTGRRKLGAIIGDGCQIGCKVVCNPGTIIGKKAVCFPNTVISGTIGQDCVVKSTASFVST